MYPETGGVLTGRDCLPRAQAAAGFSQRIIFLREAEAQQVLPYFRSGAEKCSPSHRGDSRFAQQRARLLRGDIAAQMSGFRENVVRALGSLGWHTFRHTYRSLLSGADTPMDVQQKLLRHAHISTT
jgi:integrase